MPTQAPLLYCAHKHVLSGCLCERSEEKSKSQPTPELTTLLSL